jgi:hypothetical protein
MEDKLVKWLWEITIGIARAVNLVLGKRASAYIGLLFGISIGLVCLAIRPAIYGAFAYLAALGVVKWLKVTSVLGWTIDPRVAGVLVFLVAWSLVKIPAPPTDNKDLLGWRFSGNLCMAAR